MPEFECEDQREREEAKETVGQSSYFHVRLCEERRRFQTWRPESQEAHSDRGVHTATTENDRQLGISDDGSRRSLSKPSPEKLRTEIDRDGKGKELNKCGRLTSVNTLCEHTAHDKVAQ